MKKAFSTVPMGDDYDSEYDFKSGEIADNISRDVQVLFSQSIDLSVAGSLELDIPGRAIVLYGFTTASPIKARADILVNVRHNYADAPAFPAKSNRGVRGAFRKVFLSWAAQASVSADVIILKSSRDPWQNDGPV